jgi:hypothetical protein
MTMVSEHAAEQAFRHTANDVSSMRDVLRTYRPALRERDLAKRVAERALPRDVAELARVVRDGHELGIEELRRVAAELALPPLREHADLVATVCNEHGIRGALVAAGQTYEPGLPRD